jgi:DNA-binding NarL/FixJ family response regulator
VSPFLRQFIARGQPTSPTKKIRLLLVEDNRLLREGIMSLMKEHEDIRVVAALGTNDNIVQKAKIFKPHVMLLDLGLRSQNSLQLVKAAKEHSSMTKVIVMDLIPTQADILEFVRAGVSGFILKDATMEEFLKTIRVVARGERVLPSLLTGSLFSQIVEHAVIGSQATSSKLMEAVRMTKRERQVIALVSEGMTNKEIAQKLHLSTYTVKSHVHNILEKLALHTRVQIARYAHTSENFQEAASAVTLMNE